MTLKVTSFGAQGDAVSVAANTVKGSPVITVQTTDALTNADVGKLMLLFGVGPSTTPTNHQDLIGTIEQVDHGTNITLSVAAGATSNNVSCIYGTQNAPSFQSCVDAANGSNTIIQVPAGNYLLVPPAQVSGFAMIRDTGPVAAAVVIRKGGIHFLGDGLTKTILTGCGAWRLQGKFVHRGWLFVCQGPITNNYPLVFEDLTMDGGVQVGYTANHFPPANPADGSGWDITHDAVVDSGRAPLHLNKVFENCRFTHWRGEMLKGVVGGWDGHIVVTNCLFDDGNASAFNMSFTHRISSCLFSNLNMAMEFYEGYCSNACFFENSTLTQIMGGTAIAIVGALTNRPPPEYTIQNNHFWCSHFAILTSPAQNLYVMGNQFYCTNATAALGFGSAGYQGSAINRNIVVADNSFNGPIYAIAFLGIGGNRIADLQVISNTATGVRWFAGCYGWSTNVSFRGNTAPAGLCNDQLKGQWFLDDASNTFPPWSVNGSAGKTNVITYAHGMRQRLASTNSGSAFAFDDSQPEKIPPGARLQITFCGKQPASLYFSTTRPDAGSVIVQQSNDTVTCAWTNKAWVRAEVR